MPALLSLIFLELYQLFTFAALSAFFHNSHPLYCDYNCIINALGIPHLVLPNALGLPEPSGVYTDILRDQ